MWCHPANREWDAAKLVTDGKKGKGDFSKLSEWFSSF